MTGKRRSRATDLILFVFVYFLVSSAAFSGFFGKWNFRDNALQFSVEEMLDGTADRPYVYRQLMPAVSNIFASFIPLKTQRRIEAHLSVDFPEHNAIAKIYAGTKYAANPDTEVRYYLLYFVCFVSLFISLLVLRLVLLESGFSALAATVAPLIFALLIPVLSTHGGYFYDLPEIGFMGGAVLLAMRGREGFLILLTAVATFNKESFLFFVITLYPFLEMRLSTRRALCNVAVLVATAAIVNVLVKHHFSHNGGGMVEVHFWANLRAYLNLKTYFQYEWTYGVISPKGMSVLTVVLLGIVAWRGWPALSLVTRHHLKVGAIINIPLFLVFCEYDELRNFSLLYVGFVSLIAAVLDSYLFRAAAQGERPAYRTVNGKGV